MSEQKPEETLVVEADHDEVLSAVLRQRAALKGLLAEVLDDLEHVVNGTVGYIDRDMLDGYRERAGLDDL